MVKTKYTHMRMSHEQVLVFGWALDWYNFNMFSFHLCYCIWEDT